MLSQAEQRVIDLASGQHSVFTLAQATKLGCTPDLLKRRVREGRLDRPREETFRIRGSVDSWHQRVMIACLSEKGVASHQTAAALHGLRGFGGGVVHVTAHRWKRRPRRGIRLHESTDLAPEDITIIDGIPCTTLVRTLIDLGATCHIFRVGVALDDAVRRGRTSYGAVAVRNEALRRRGRRGTGVMKRLLAERPGGRVRDRTELERAVYKVLVDGDLPPPEQNYAVEVDGEKYEIDIAWPDVKLGIEAQSEEFHYLDLHHFHRDSARLNKLQTAGGWTILLITSRRLADPADLVAEVRLALELASEKGVRRP